MPKPHEQIEIARCFDYHAPEPEDRAKYEQLTSKVRELAELICDLCPQGSDRDAALMQLRLTRMLANASIACDPVRCIS